MFRMLFVCVFLTALLIVPIFAKPFLDENGKPDAKAISNFANDMVKNVLGSMGGNLDIDSLIKQKTGGKGLEEVISEELSKTSSGEGKSAKEGKKGGKKGKKSKE